MSAIAVADQPKIGRPRKFTDAVELEQAINAYFHDCDSQQRPYTMAGLARTLDCSTETLRKYQHDDYADEPFIAAVKRAKQRVEQWTEERLYGKGHPAGPIFSLKNNFGWRDEQQIQHAHLVIGVGAARPPARLSPTQDIAIALSPRVPLALSDASEEAKAPPIVGVSPHKVA